MKRSKKDTLPEETPAAASSGKNYHHPDLKTALLEAAVHLLETDGIKGFSLRKVAAAAGVSHTAPYRHFKNRDELLGSIVLEGHRRLTAAQRLAGASAAGSAFDILQALGAAYLEFARQNAVYLTLMFSRESMDALQNMEKTIPPHEAEQYDSFGVLERAVAACQKEGSLNPERDTTALSMCVWSGIHGLSCLRNEGVIAAMGASRGYTEQDVLTSVTDAMRDMCTGTSNRQL